jgi:hypothetical protein
MGGDLSKKKEHLSRPNPFQQNFVPQYNPYGSNFYAYSPKRRHRRHGRRHRSFGPYRDPYAASYFGPQVLIPENQFSMNRGFIDPVIPFGQAGSLYGENLGFSGNPGFPNAFEQPMVVNPPCGGSQCTSYENSDGNYEAPIGTQCTCCALGKICRMNPPNGIKYNDCCAGMDCVNNVCMKK